MTIFNSHSKLNMGYYLYNKMYRSNFLQRFESKIKYKMGNNMIGLLITILTQYSLTITGGTRLLLSFALLLYSVIEVQRQYLKAIYLHYKSPAFKLHYSKRKTICYFHHQFMRSLSKSIYYHIWIQPKKQKFKIMEWKQILNHFSFIGSDYLIMIF